MKKKLLGVAAASVIASGAAQAQSNIYLDLSSAGINGESQSDEYKGQIDVIAWGWGLSNSTEIGDLVGGGGAVGRTTFQALSVDKNVDSASSGIYAALASGDRVKEAIITNTVFGGVSGKEQALTEVTMQDVIFVGAQQGAAAGDDRPTESISMIFSKFCLQQNTFNKEGALVDGVPFCWDIGKNEAF